MDYNNFNPTPSVAAHLSNVMKRVYLRMFLGLLISAFCALGVASIPSVFTLLFSNQFIYWGMLIAVLAIAWIVPSRITKMSTGSVVLWFCIFAALMGAMLSSIFIVYRIGSIISTFFIAAGVFGAMSVYGYLTKANLAKFGSYCMMALFGLIIVMIVNIFLHSSTLEWIVSIIGVVLFIGLTAWDTQQMKVLAQSNLDPALTDKLATIGAMNLYLDFINLFLFLLRIFGGNRD